MHRAFSLIAALAFLSLPAAADVKVTGPDIDGFVTFEWMRDGAAYDARTFHIDDPAQKYAEIRDELLDDMRRYRDWRAAREPLPLPRPKPER